MERSSSTICSASSRVGARTRAAGRRASASMRSTSGMPKANVLPEPVGDWTRTSSPARTSAMQSLCTAKGSVMPRLARAPRIGRDTPRSANDSDDMQLTPYVRWGDPVTQRRIRSAGRKRNLSGTRLVDPTPTTVAGSAVHAADPARAGRCGSDGFRRFHAEPGAGLADRHGRGPAGLGDLVVGALGVSVDLELDPRLGAKLKALLVGGALVDPVEARLAGHLAAARQAIEVSVLPRPGARQARPRHLRGEAHRHLAAGAGPVAVLPRPRRRRFRL